MELSRQFWISLQAFDGLVTFEASSAQSIVRRHIHMQPIFRVIVNRTEERPITCAQDIDRLCTELAGLPVFAVHIVGAGGEEGATLDVIVESGRAVVDFLDIGRGVKLASRDMTSTGRGVMSFRNDIYPELQLDQIEVHCRDLISPTRAIWVLRHYLNTGEPIDLVRWPPDDWDEWGDSEVVPDPPGEDVSF